MQSYELFRDVVSLEGQFCMKRGDFLTLVNKSYSFLTLVNEYRCLLIYVNIHLIY